MGSVPVRTCTGCRARRPQDELVKVVRGPDGVVRLAVDGGVGGRGAYTCPDEGCIRRAFGSGRLRRVLRSEEELPDSLHGQMLKRSKGQEWQSRGFTK